MLRSHLLSDVLVGTTLARCALAFQSPPCQTGARILLSPCAWAVDADHDNRQDRYGSLWIGDYGTIAKQHRMPVIGVSNVGWLAAGPWQGRKCIGCSLAVGPSGEVLAQGPHGESAEELIVVDLT